MESSSVAKRGNLWRRVFLWLAVAALLFEPVSGLTVTARANGSESDQAKLAEAALLTGAVEKPSKRTANSRVFETPDGRGWAEIYQHHIHFQDSSGNWQEISSDLIPTVFDPNYQYRNEANRYFSYFKSDLTSEFFSFKQGADQVFFSLQGANNNVTASVSGTSVTYANALSGTDLRYVADSDGVKGEIILNEEPKYTQVAFLARVTSGLMLALNAEGDVEISKSIAGDDEDPISIPLWRLPKPSVVKQVTGEPVFGTYSLIAVNSDTYQITFDIINEFLPPPERGYPVIIDPSIVIVGNQNTASNYVLEYDNSVLKNSPANTILPVGRTSYGEARGYLKFDVGGIPSNAQINSAMFAVTTHEERSSIPRIKLYRVTQDWNPDALRWSNQPSVASSFDDSFTNNIVWSWWNFDITDTVKGWRSGSLPNYGLSLRGHDPNISRRYFLSKYYLGGDGTAGEFRPHLLVHYDAPAAPKLFGQKPWWRYVSTPLAIGTASVNVASGNLTFGFNDVSVKDRGIDVSVSHTYNSRDDYNDKFGYGWTISANKRLVPSQDRKTVLFIDETNTSFTFKDENGNGNYVDDVYDAASGFYRRPNRRPNGLNWGLKYDSGANRYIAKTNSGQSLIFDAVGKILEERDRNNNKITYHYSSGNLVAIEGQSGRKVKLYYDGPGGRLSKIEDYNTEDPNFRDSNGGVVAYEYDGDDLKVLRYLKYGQSVPEAVIVFNYSNHKLTSIVDARGNSTSFSYDGSGRVTDIYDAENKRTQLQYPSSGLTKVISAKFFDEGGDQEKFQTDYHYRINPYFQTGLVYREITPKLKNHLNQEIRNTVEYDYNDDYFLHATTDPTGNVDASAYDDISGLLFYQFNENKGMTLKNTYSPSSYDEAKWRLVDSYSGNGTQTTFNYDTNGNLLRKGVMDGSINQLYNPGYESTTRDPSAYDPTCAYVKAGVADFWCGSGTLSNNRIYGIDTSTFTDGSKSQYVGFNNTTSAGSVNAFQEVEEAVRPLPDTDYVVSWKYKNESTNGFGVQIAVIHYDTRGNQIGSTLLDSKVSSTSWADRSFTFRTPINNPTTGWPYWTSDIFMRAHTSNPNVTAKAWFDSVKLERGTVASQQTEKKTEFTYTNQSNPNPTGLPLTEKTPEGKVLSYEYDSQGNLLKTTDPLGKETTYTYDANGNRLSKVEPNGNATTNDPDDFKFAYTYDARGRIKSVTEVKFNRATTYKYDPNGNLIETVTPNGLKTTYTYDKVNRSKLTTNPYGYESEVKYDAQGNPKGITDPNGNNSNAAYDGNDRLTQETNPQGQNTAYNYDNNDNLKKVDEAGKTLQYNYDAAGQLTSETNNSSGSNRTIEYQYDNNGNITIINNQTGEVINHTYSATDEVTRVTVGGLTTTYTRNKNNQLTKLEKPNGDITEYFYDDNARVTRIEHKRSGNTFLKYEYLYDANGNRTQVKTTQNGNTETVDYEYDNLNQLKKIITAAKTTTYTYDHGGNITRIEDTTNAWTNLTYDGNRLVKKTDSLNNIEYFGFDASGNMTSRDTADKVDLLAHLNNNLVNARDNQAGKVIDQANPVFVSGKFGQALQLDGQTYLSFSSSSNINKDAGTLEIWVKPHWDNDSNVRTFFEYYVNADNMMRLQKLSDNKLYFSMMRDGALISSAASLATNWVNGDWYHLAAAWTDSAVTIYINGVKIQQFQLIALCPPTCNPPFVGRSPKINFGASVTGQTPTNYADATLDEIRLSSFVRTDQEITDSYSATNEFTLPNTIIYEYDSHDYLTKITQPGGTVYEYKYDANKRRTKRIKTGTTDINYQYDGDKLTTELNNDGSVIAKYAYSSEGQLLKITRGTTNYYPITDGLGSIVLVRDSSGNTINSYEYDEWGKVINKTEQFPLPLRFAGYWQDNDTGLYHLGARWYDPTLYRFTSVDPYPGERDSQISLNEYIYAKNNPLIYTDHDGRNPRIVILALGLVSKYTKRAIQVIKKNVKWGNYLDKQGQKNRWLELGGRVRFSIDAPHGVIKGHNYWHLQVAIRLKPRQDFKIFTRIPLGPTGQ